MRRLLMENIDRASDQVIDLDRQQVLKRTQRVLAGLVGIDDLVIIIGVGHQNVGRHVIDHLRKAVGFGVGLDLGGHNTPGQHRLGIVAIGVINS